MFSQAYISHQHSFVCRIFEEMKPAYSITYGKGPPVIRRGKLYPVKLSLVQKMGNKKVTLVDNLECYGIPASDLAQSLQKLAAASTTCESSSPSLLPPLPSLPLPSLPPSFPLPSLPPSPFPSLYSPH